MKGRKLSLLFFAVLFAVLAKAQNDSAVVMTINGDPVYKSEFAYIYNKNNKDSVITKKDLDNYLDLFINFKLKVKEAEALGMDTTHSFISELKGYREQLARPYLVDNQMSDELLHEAYKRMKTEVKASHILIKVAPDAPPADTLKAWKKIMDIKKQIEAGADFGKMAAKYSEDPSAKENQGDLGYFTALQMVYPFETAAYNTPVGKIAGPIRTRYGYHLIKVTDKRPARGDMRVAHIMVKVAKDDPADVQEAAKKRIDEIYQHLQDGEDFATLARKFSDDRVSAAKGGELPPFTTGQMVKVFEDTSFALKHDGDISKPFRSPYGWHIVKRLEYIPIKSFDDMKSELSARIAKDSRSQLSQKSFIAKKKKEFNFQENDKNLKYLQSIVDTSIFSGNWKVPSRAKLDKPLFSFAQKNFTVGDMADRLLKIQHKIPGTHPELKAYVKDQYDHFVNESITKYEDSRLEKEYPKFRELVQEYHDGILLFGLMDKMVWTKAVKDSAGLQQYYKDHQDKYMFGPRIAADIYTCKDQDIAKKVQKMLKKGKNQEEIKETIDKDSQLNLSVESGLFEKSDKPYLDKFTWKKGIFGPFEADSLYALVNVKELSNPSPKPLDTIRGIVTSDYQNYLEDQWIKQLRDKYKVVVNKDVLYSLITAKN